MSISAPVVIIIFNRPSLTERVFEIIARIEPKKVFIIADGPRFPEEAEKCQKARAVVDKIGWNCEVFKKFSDKHLGCRYGISAGLDWVFSQSEEAIILEDDCVPSPSFFYFCQELLNKYRNEKRIMNISGSNFQRGRRIDTYDYFFSIYPHAWGWATWKRAWQLYDVDMKTYPEEGLKVIHKTFKSHFEREYWKKTLDMAFIGEQVDCWDYQWFYTCWLYGALSINPNVNLVSNIGFDSIDSTHCKEKAWLAGLPVGNVGTMQHFPATIAHDKKADADTFMGRFIRLEAKEKNLTWYRARYYMKYMYRMLYKKIALLKRNILKNKNARLLQEWEKIGKPMPMPEQLKRMVIISYAKKFAVRTFIETGTYRGDTVDAVKDIFQKIFSIELSKKLFLETKYKFLKHKHITILQGDSAKVLPHILANLSQPCLFWLDAHHTCFRDAVKGEVETPLVQELNCILEHLGDHVILIDDARLTTVEGKTECLRPEEWPMLEELKTLVFKKRHDWIFEVKNDIIRIHKRQEGDKSKLFSRSDPYDVL
ncbi:MAG: hypothetical protein PHV55_08585 [Candidatus Omnitrophica bacterium]|nr:hypothetical protein [Candidatus Omnitrophota bacterium]